jgi:hypothetical protein
VQASEFETCSQSISINKFKYIEGFAGFLTDCHQILTKKISNFLYSSLLYARILDRWVHALEGIILSPSFHSFTQCQDGRYVK